MMPDSADQTVSTVASGEQEYRFNKFGSVGKAAGFFIVTTGYIIRSVASGFEGGWNFSNLVDQVSPPAALLYAAVFLAMLAYLVITALRPANHLKVTPSEVVFSLGDRVQRMDIGDIIAVASFERDGPGFAGRRKPRRSIAVLTVGGAQLAKVPDGVNWKSINPEPRRVVSDVVDRDLVDQILADTIDSELPDDDFGEDMRSRVPRPVSRQVAGLKREHDGLKAMVIPLRGMPAETEDELRESLPNWL